MRRRNVDRKMYEIRKYNFATCELIEIYPQKIMGRARADACVIHLRSELTPEEKADGISWYHKP